uniref:Uncharacterized protein n=1 Tax=Anguilla anguilla TaxID=7936 RepID=A0A0E9V4V1_ANGAN
MRRCEDCSPTCTVSTGTHLRRRLHAVPGIGYRCTYAELKRSYLKVFI